MPLLTVNARIQTDEPTSAVLLDAMMCATKVYNGVMWAIRQELEKSGKLDLGLRTLDGYLKELPRSKGYYSRSAQATRDEVCEAWKSFLALKANGETKHNAPGYRRKGEYSGLRYFGDNGVKFAGNTLQLSLGLSREDKVRQVSLRVDYRTDLKWKRLVNVLLTHDKRTGFTAHLVIEVDAVAPLGTKKVAVDLGETQLITAMFDDGPTLLINGRHLKSIRRYWQKVRAKVKPPDALRGKPSRRFQQIADKERRQIHHALHIISRDFVRRCYRAGVDEIAIGDLTNIRDYIDYGDKLNQRLHAWPFAKLTTMLTYKAELFGIQVVAVSEVNSSRTCHACGEINKHNRKSRGAYRCACGGRAHADVNAAANLLERVFKVSPVKWSSGEVTTPTVVSLRLNLKRRMICASRPHLAQPAP